MPEERTDLPAEAQEGVVRVVAQGRALVRAIEAFETIEASAWLERFLADVLKAAYERRLRAIIATAPSWVGGRILEAMDGSPNRNRFCLKTTERDAQQT